MVGEGERDIARVIALQLAEHGADMRRVSVDGWQHDDYVTRAQRRVGAEAGQQLVMENLHFALRAVCNVEADRAVFAWIDWRPQLTGFSERAQFKNVVLQLVEQCGGRAVAEQVDAPIAERTLVAARVVIAVEQVDVVAALFAPGGQQRMSMLVQQLVVQLQGHALFALLAFVLVAQQVLVGNDVGPVVAAGVVHAQQYLAKARQACQCFQGLCRQRGNAEHDHPRWQPCGRLFQVVDALGEALMYSGAALRHALLTNILQQGSPQLGLPAVARRQGFALTTGSIEDVIASSPVLEPVGAVDLVLVEQVSQSLGELVALAQVAVVIEEALQRLEMRALYQGWQQAHQAPGQWGLVEQGNFGNFVVAQHAAVQLPHEAARQLHIDCGSDAAATQVIFQRVFSQGQFEPLGDTIALDKGDFVFQRCQGVTAHPAHHQAA